MFYTYAHYTPQGRLFYIGKGRGKRAHRFYNRGSHWDSIVAKYGKPDVQILANWDTEEAAFSHEKLLISCFRDMGHKLCNITDGGEGASGRELSAEHKAKISIGCKGKWSWITGKSHSIETRLKISASTLGKKKSKEHGQNIGKAKLGNKYNVGKLYNVKYQCLGTSLQTGEQIMLVGSNDMASHGFNPSRVRDCANGKRKTHKGYIWQKVPFGE